MKPTRNNILVRKILSSKETESGIILKSSDEPDRGFVEKIGPEVAEVSIGETVILNWNRAVHADSDLYIVSIDEVIMVVE